VSKSFRPEDFVSDYARTLIRVKARQLIRRTGFSRSDQDDIEQDLFLHLLSQARQFDPARGSLNTFIARVVDTAVAMLLRKRSRQKRKPERGVELHSLEVIVEVAGEPPVPLWATITTADIDRRTGASSTPDARAYEDAEALAEATKALADDLRDVLRLFLDRSPSAAAKELGISRRKLRVAIATIREQFVRAGLRERFCAHVIRARVI
jgi:RNA polymerase sigma-70 factor (ECF subfamily)